MPQKLFDLAESEGIIVHWFNLAHPLRGVYWAPDNAPPAIGLDYSLQHNNAECRAVMAEEVGHHYTSSGIFLCRTFFNYRDRLIISKEEYEAITWAALYLMPERKLFQAFKKNITSVWELSEYFSVTEELTNHRLRLAKLKLLQGTILRG